MLKKLTQTLLCCAALLTANANAAIIEVDLELQLLADISGSVSSSEYALQISGYEAAFRDTSVINAIVNGQKGGIAVQYIEWARNAGTRIDWFYINSSATANAFADLLQGFTTKMGGINTGYTYINEAIDYGKGLFFNNNYDAARQVMDISGDGTSNVSSTATARDSALALGVDTINGITIGGSSSLDNFYTNNVIGGTNPFLISAGSFGDFTTGIKQKLVREITGGGGATVPEPSSIALFGLAILGLASASRKKAK